MPEMTLHSKVQRGVPVSGTPHPALLTVVAIGASAGGLEASTKLVRGLPDGNGMAFILVQHLDPTHRSMLVDLLAPHTAMPVIEALNGIMLEPDHLYVIPPGTYLSASGDALRLSKVPPGRGTRLPFDFLLRSLAEGYGKRAVCVVLSGTGADGALGLVAIKDRGGLVIVQDPDEAEYDEMPRSAIATGVVDMVLAVNDISDALATHPHPVADGRADEPAAADPEQKSFLAIIELLRTTTPHDFTLYKPGTLQRRIERRMAMAGAADLSHYLVRLQGDPEEAGRVAADLLINVTSFFRDPEVFARLEADIIPGLIRDHAASQPLRIWIAGCSTGEETWSLAMLFREQLEALQSSIKLQVFASDVDADAVAQARAGRYPETIATDVSQARLARFFTHDEHGYDVVPELRAMVVFTVQDVLADPPFSRLDFVSCRNLLIYLRRDAQARVLSLFDFALREGGILLLGAAETPGKDEGRFQLIGKQERLYRRIGVGRPNRVQFPTAVGRLPVAAAPARAATGQMALADLGQRLVLDAYVPAAILVNSRNEYLYSLGPVDRYLRVAAGSATQDVLTMARDGVRSRLRAALRKASHAVGLVTSPATLGDDARFRFDIEVRPIVGGGQATRLICFVERRLDVDSKHVVRPGVEPQIAELEREVADLRAELAETFRSSEASGEEQRALNEEALSANEEYQSTNEELLTSKEELQSLNEELSALNSQLQETLERQRTTSNDMQNVLYSTDVATLFLDREMNIRFFTPATRSLFNVIPGDVGRPLSDLVWLATDTALAGDTADVLRDLVPVEREIEANGAWFVRRVLPYRTENQGVEGVVITFTNVTERKHAARALEAAKQEADRANAAKSRFLAAASHDLRQPLQTLALLQGLLAKVVAEPAGQELVTRLDDTLDAMSVMLNTVLDTNQIDAGVVSAEIVTFPIAGMLAKLRDEYVYQAQAQGLSWQVVQSSLWITSDQRLLEQMVRNLVSNALKYTPRGKVLLGCKRQGGTLRVEVWDTGIGIPEDKLDDIFEEYCQLGNAARDREKGLGLGLAIVQRLGGLLGHKVSVRSRQGAGSVFSIEVPLGTDAGAPEIALAAPSTAVAGRTGTILIVEDEPEVRNLLEQFLHGEGHRVFAAANGPAALALVASGQAAPDLLLTDYNLPGGLNGLELAARLRLDRVSPLCVIILTGDVSALALREAARQDCIALSKPVKLDALTNAVQDLLLPERAPSYGEPRKHVESGSSVIFIVDDAASVRTSVRTLLEAEGRTVEDHGSSESFLDAYHPGRGACLLLDATLPGLSGLDLLRKLREAGDRIPTILITGHGDVHMAVEAMRAGASDFIEKPVGRAELLASLERALDQSSDSETLSSWRATAAQAVKSLTNRQRQIMTMIIAGHPSKNIAADLGISQRTVENHRAAIMQRTNSKSLPALTRLALAAAWTGSDGSLVAAGPAAKTAR